MLNWNVDEARFKKEDPEGYKLWRLTQLINYGLDGEKLKADEVKRAWPKIEEHLDPYIKRYLEYLLWGKLYSLPINLNFMDICRLKYEKWKNLQKSKKV